MEKHTAGSYVNVSEPGEEDEEDEEDGGALRRARSSPRQPRSSYLEVQTGVSGIPTDRNTSTSET